MFSAIEASGLFPPINWEVIVDSTIVGLKKPDPAIFDLARKQANVAENEILFVDNAEKNTSAAAQMGWQTFLYDSSNYEESTAKLTRLLQ